MTDQSLLELSLERPDQGDAAIVKTLRKALSVLDAVATADAPLTVAQIALVTGLSRPTTHRLVQTLVADGYLAPVARTSTFTVGFSVLQLAASLLDRNRLRIEALPHLQTLAQKSGERTNLGILHKGAVLYLGGVEKLSLPPIYSRFGKTAPLHCCSLGKAILAFSPEDEVRALLSRPLVPQTPNSITDPEVLMRELHQARIDGYAVDREEHMPGSFCVATPIFDRRNRPVGAIGLSGRDITPLLDEVANLRHTAELISHGL